MFWIVSPKTSLSLAAFVIILLIYEDIQDGVTDH